MIPPAILNAIARIEVQQPGLPSGRGTGFLVADGLVLTALHVVANVKVSPVEPYAGPLVLHFPGFTTTAAIHENYWDAGADWALLRCAAPPEVPPVPLGEPRSDAARWETHGYPDAQFLDGLVNVGEVSSWSARLKGAPVYQLYSREAAAGTGEPVQGFSGSPVIVDNAVVGLLRFALLEGKNSRAGTLYACPIASVMEKAGPLLRTPDPCPGLPGLPRKALPVKPFRHLSWFTEKEAEVFFGRNADVAQLYGALTGADAAPVCLLYGLAGVGKSSLLDGGVAARLRRDHEVCYLRHDREASLLETLRSALVSLGATPESPLPVAWAAVERNAGKPLVVLFDQIEEVYTRSHLESGGEFPAFARELASLFSAPSPPRGRLSLCFRKEWLPAIEDALQQSEVDYGRYPLHRLSREGIVAAVSGLTSTPRLREFYRLTAEPGAAEQIAADMMTDPDSPIAPTLQILLTRMWEKAKAAAPHAPAFTGELYGQFKREGLLLDDFVAQQLAGLRAERGEWVESGLALDVLVSHTTALGRAAEFTSGELLAMYPHRGAEIADVVEELEARLLLSDTSGEAGPKSTGLLHDTMALAVRRLYAGSEWPGQRARRVLESRLQEWIEGSESGLLDAESLAVVEHGLSGMRRRTSAEQTFVDQSWAHHKKIARLLEVARLRLAVSDSMRLLQTDPARALMLAVAAIARGTQDGAVDPVAQATLLRAIDEAREEDVLPLERGFALTMDSAADGTLAVLYGYGEQVFLRLWEPGEPPRDVEIDFMSNEGPRILKFSPDGTRLALGGIDTPLVIIQRDGSISELLRTRYAVSALAFTPDWPSVMLVSRLLGTLTAWGYDGQVRWEVECTPERSGGVAPCRYWPGSEQPVLLAGVPNGTVEAWSEQGEKVGELTGVFRSVAIDTLDSATYTEPPTYILAAGERHDTAVLIAGDKRRQFAFPGLAIETLRFGPAGDIALGLSDGSVRVMDYGGGEVVPPLRGMVPGYHPPLLAFGPAPGRLAVRPASGREIRVFDLNDGPLKRTRNVWARGPLQWSRDGRYLTFKGESFGAWDWELDAFRFVSSDPVHAAAFSIDGRRIVTGDTEGRVEFAVDGGGTESVSLPGTAIEKLCFSPDGERVLIATGDLVEKRWQVLAWRPGSREPRLLWTQQGFNLYDLVNFSPDGSRFVTTTSWQEWGADLRVWSTAPDSQAEPLFQRRVEVTPDNLGFAPDGRTVTFTDRKTLYLWTPAEAGVEESFVEEHYEPGFGRRPALHPNGELIFVVGVGQESIHIYHRPSGERIGEFRGGEKVDELSAVSPDGTMIASIQEYSRVCIWRGCCSEWLEVAAARLRKHPVMKQEMTDPFAADDRRLAAELIGKAGRIRGSEK